MGKSNHYGIPNAVPREPTSGPFTSPDELVVRRTSTTMQAQMVAESRADFGEPLPQELESELAELRRLRSEVSKLRDQNIKLAARLGLCVCGQTRSKR